MTHEHFEPDHGVLLMFKLIDYMSSLPGLQLIAGQLNSPDADNRRAVVHVSGPEPATPEVKVVPAQPEVKANQTEKDIKDVPLRDFQWKEFLGAFSDAVQQTLNMQLQQSAAAQDSFLRKFEQTLKAIQSDLGSRDVSRMYPAQGLPRAGEPAALAPWDPGAARSYCSNSLWLPSCAVTPDNFDRGDKVLVQPVPMAIPR